MEHLLLWSLLVVRPDEEGTGTLLASERKCRPLHTDTFWRRERSPLTHPQCWAVFRSRWFPLRWDRTEEVAAASTAHWPHLPAASTEERDNTITWQMLSQQSKSLTSCPALHRSRHNHPLSSIAVTSIVVIIAVVTIIVVVIISMGI